MKKIIILTALALVGMTAVAAQNTAVTVREVRNPNTLVSILNANAADAEARLTSGSTTAEFLNLINLSDAGTSYITFQADKADDAGDKWGIVASDSSGLLIQSDKDSKGTLATKLTVGETGILTMKGSATIDNTTSASVLNLTETTVAITGDGTVSGTLGVTGVATFTATPVCSADLTVTSNQTIGGTLAVTGVGTFTAESVHNGGIDADYITTDAAAGIDTKSAGTLLVGASTATKVEIGDSGVTTEVQGPLTVLGSTGNGLDAAGATALYIGESTATSLVLGASDITTTILGPTTVLGGTGKGIDTTAAGALYLGEATATSVVLGASDANTTVAGDLVVTGLDIDSAAGAMTIGKAVATSLTLGASDITTSVAGPLTVLEATGKGIDTTGAGALYLGEATATSVVIGASDANTTVAGNLTVSAGTITATGNSAKIWLGTNGFFQVYGGALQFVGHNGFTNALDADITQ